MKPRQTITSIALFTLALAGALSGCQKKPKKTEPSASGTATAKVAGAKASGPCEEYATKLCAKAGEQTSLCGATKMATGVMAPAACSAAIKEFSLTENMLKDQRKACDALVTKLCTETGNDSEVCAMIKSKIPQVPSEQCGGALEHYDDVKKQLTAAVMANKPLPADVQAKIAATDAPSFGPADAKVTIVEFSDFECPYCSRAAAVTEQIRAKYKDRVRFVFRQFPLPMHSNAKKAAEAALAANAQGKFWEFHDLMFKNQKQLEESALEGYAKQAGLNVAGFKDALSTSKFSAQVDADTKLGQEVGVQGTPTMFINGKRIDNPSDFGSISTTLDGLLKTAG
ncbi:MAG: thioredoxin domain-containing protein [Polyangiaceae bacterium]|nr:thioredoxin domain-containing protein [Polyangiaceae bacterium]